VSLKRVDDACERANHVLSLKVCIIIVATVIIIGILYRMRNLL